MKIEKLNENKIKITLSMEDLEEKDISFHDFMSNSLESQDLFSVLLEEAEAKVGFKTNNCRVKVEALAMTEDDFVLTITKMATDSLKRRLYATPRKKPIAKRIDRNRLSNNVIYRFNSFDDYCYFIEFLSKNNLTDASKVAEKILLYLYNDQYYLVLTDLNTKYKKIPTFYTSITEFGSYIINPDLFISKLNESGTVFLKNNAFKKSFLHFVKK